MPPPSNRRAFPDKAHEDLAVWVEETLADLKATKTDVATTRGNSNQHGADISDVLLLIDALFGLIDDLTARVAVLEQPLP